LFKGPEGIITGFPPSSIAEYLLGFVGFPHLAREIEHRLSLAIDNVVVKNNNNPRFQAQYPL
jgi:hypothetical protein